MVTAGTYLKQPHINSAERLDFVLDLLLNIAGESGWSLHAWAVLSNHYHFVGQSTAASNSLSKFLGKLHMKTAQELNLRDATSGRKVWYQFRDIAITFERSYLARLNYVHNNPVHHGIVDSALDYAWCSAAWFERSAQTAFVKTVQSFKTDSVNVDDDY